MTGILLAAAALSLALGVPAQWVGARLRLQRGKGGAVTGGLAVIAAWWLVALVGLGFSPREALGLALAMLPLLAVGLQDLRRPLGPLPQLAGQILTALAAVLVGGIQAAYVTNPLGGLFYLNQWEIAGILLPGALFSFVWITLLMNAVNFLDGMDGLATSVSTVGFLTIAAVSFLPQVNEPHVARLALVAAGAGLGFFFWNFPPARLTLGTPGAWFLGFLLAVLSLEGSSKIATLTVVGAIPILDALAVVLRRLRSGASPFRGDRAHFHHRLEARGWSPRAILVLYVVVSAALGVAAVVLPTPLKTVLVTLAVLATASVALSARRVARFSGPR